MFKELVSKCGFVNLISAKRTDTLKSGKLYFVRKKQIMVIFPSSTFRRKHRSTVLILSFRRVLNVDYFVLGKSPASVCY
jgi:hypothetical protein